MMRLCSIASGSSGNCIYVGDDRTHLLVDTGISKKRIEEGLHSLGIRGDELSAILITHEHIDHIRGLAFSAGDMRSLFMRPEVPLREYAVQRAWGRCRMAFFMK